MGVVLCLLGLYLALFIHLGEELLLLSKAHASPSAPLQPFPPYCSFLLSASPVHSIAPPLEPSLSLAYASVSLMYKKPTLPGPNLTTPSPSFHTQALEEEDTTLQLAHLLCSASLLL